MNAPRRRLEHLPFALLLSLLVLPGAWLMAQVKVDDPTLLNEPLSVIEIAGNQVTKREIILREMQLRAGMTPTMKLLRADQMRVLRLNLFTRVELVLEQRNEQAVLRVNVTERWYIFPQPYWRFKGDDPQKLIYGLRYLQDNFRGRNETLILDLYNGADKGFQFSHQNPWMRGTPELSRTVELFQITRESQQKSLQNPALEERHSHAGLRLGKRWTLDLFSEISFNLRLIQGEIPQQLSSGGLLDRVLETRVWTYYDARDLRTFPRRGFLLSAQYAQGWILNGHRNYQRLFLDARGYIPYNKAALAARMQWLPGWGDVPPYDWIYVTENAPIRSSHLSDEGNSFYMASLETRLDIYSLRYFTWHRAPFFRRYFRDLGFGLSAEFFVDAGDAYFAGELPGWNSVMWGYGTGLLVILPYVDVLRMELSWNPDYSWSATRLSVKTEISF